LFLPDDGQGDWPKHIASCNKSEGEKVRELCFVCIGLLLSKVPYSFDKLSDSVETTSGLRQSDSLATFVIVFCVGPTVTHRMYCSLPRLIVLTPL
jgi:hypothetical protein